MTVVSLSCKESSAEGCIKPLEGSLTVFSRKVENWVFGNSCFNQRSSWQELWHRV